MADPVRWVRIHFETPRDKEAEDYLYHFRQINDAGIKCVNFARVCDGCGINLHFKAEDVEFKCRFCATRYDLCTDCQPCYDAMACPPGYGCGNQLRTTQLTD